MDQMITLSPDNLEYIYNMLLESQKGAEKTLGLVSSFEDIQLVSENRLIFNELLDSVGLIVREIAHVDAFIQECLLLDQTMFSPVQKKLLDQCNEVCQSVRETSRKVIGWTIEMKRRLNDWDVLFDRIEKTDIDSIVDEVPLEQNSSLDLLEEYDQTRAILKEVHKEILVFRDLNEMVQTAGRRLNVSQGKTLFLETSHELDVFFDYCLFQYQVGGKIIPESYYDTYAHLHSGKELKVLSAFKSSQFSLLKIKHAVSDYGLMVHDELIDEDLFMIDRGLSELASRNQNYGILTHYLRMPEFIMTTGASVGISLNSQDGRDMDRVFQDLVQRRKTTPNDGICRQYITEIYKIAIHRDVIKTVKSRELPMAYGVG